MRLQLAALCLVALAGAASAFLPPSSRLSRPAVAASRAVRKAALGAAHVSIQTQAALTYLPIHTPTPVGTKTTGGGTPASDVGGDGGGAADDGQE